MAFELLIVPPCSYVSALTSSLLTSSVPGGTVLEPRSRTLAQGGICSRGSAEYEAWQGGESRTATVEVYQCPYY